MNINNLAPEILSIILGHLATTSEHTSDDVDEWAWDDERGPTLDDLRNARLVCRRWNALATEHMFRDVALVHRHLEDQTNHSFDKFKQLTASKTVQQAARKAIIYSGPHHDDCNDMVDEDARDYYQWEAWREDGEYPGFTSAIACIAQLPKLRGVEIRFSDGCTGVDEDDYWWESGYEHSDTRLNTIREVFKTIQLRHGKKKKQDSEGDDPSAITSLAIRNLQNQPLPAEFLASHLFRSVTENITDLRLLIAQEHREDGPDHDLDHIERRTFEPWLQNTLLPQFGNQLTTLHLEFNEHWGVAPGYFDGEGLLLPHLKTLALGGYVIGHHDQFDWVLAHHKTLETLCLHNCVIVSYLTFLSNVNQVEAWGVCTHDWEAYPKWAFGHGGHHDSFYFPGTWEAVLDSIRTNLPNLVDFRMEDLRVPHRSDETLFDKSLELLTCKLTNMRYTTLDTGLLPSPWIPADEYTGNMSFGNNDPAVVPPEDRANRARYRRERAELNRARETIQGDARALDDLVQAVLQRRRTRGLHPLPAGVFSGDGFWFKGKLIRVPIVTTR